MQPLSFLSNSLRTTLTSTQPLPQILEKYSQRTHPFQESSQKAESWLETFLHSTNIHQAATCEDTEVGTGYTVGVKIDTLMLQ